MQTRAKIHSLLSTQAVIWPVYPNPRQSYSYGSANLMLGVILGLARCLSIFFFLSMIETKEKKQSRNCWIGHWYMNHMHYLCKHHINRTHNDQQVLQQYQYSVATITTKHISAIYSRHYQWKYAEETWFDVMFTWSRATVSWSTRPSGRITLCTCET